MDSVITLSRTTLLEIPTLVLLVYLGVRVHLVEKSVKKLIGRCPMFAREEKESLYESISLDDIREEVGAGLNIPKMVSHTK